VVERKGGGGGQLPIQRFDFECLKCLGFFFFCKYSHELTLVREPGIRNPD
jgi:hypothetical protein